MTKDELLAEVGSVSKAYKLAARRQEVTYWVGASVAAICSALAALSIISKISDSPEGKAVAAILAIIPAIWAAIEKTLQLRQLSVFNYGVSVRLRTIHNVAAGSDLDDVGKKLVEGYNSVLLNEHAEFATLITGDERRDDTAAVARQQAPTIQGQTAPL